MKSIKEKAAELIDGAAIITLASVTENGYPKPVPMMKLASEGISCVWFATGYDSLKAKHFLENPKAGICYHEGLDSVVLTGNIDVVTDEQAKIKNWRDSLKAHFPKGVSDPNYALLKFTPHHATFWIEDEFVRMDM